MNEPLVNSIYLAELTQDDCRRLYRQAAAEAMSELAELSEKALQNKADQWFSEIQELQHNTHLRLGVFKGDGDVIGDVALQHIDRVTHSASLGMTIVKAENRHQGFGQLAIELLLDHAFHKLTLVRVWARTLDTNIAAKRCLEKLDFTLEGREQDQLVYGMLASEYFSRYAK